MTAVIMMTAACGVHVGGSTTHSSTASGIVGITVVDVGCLVLPDREHCRERPIPAHLVVTRPNSIEAVARSDSGPDGRFRIPLPPGIYLLEPTNVTGTPLPIARPPTVKVEVHNRDFVDITVRFDSGIR
ncbi:MAG: hypothetical protein ABR615_00940 [Pseudonocardiaceae bacterium]